MPETITATVHSGRFLSAHVRELVLVPEAPFPSFLPGQWISLHLPVGEKPPLIRAYSLAMPPVPNGSLTLCFDRVENGLGSGYLWDCPVGTVLTFSGPVGNFVLPASDAPLLMVARYTGIVPFRAMLRAMHEGNAPPRSIHLVYGAPSDRERVYHDELAALSDEVSWFTYQRAAEGKEITWLFNDRLPWQPTQAMVCGIRAFTLPVRSHLMETFSLERRAVKVENYTGPQG